MQKRDMVRTDVRQAGNVQRYHTWPVNHRQTVAHHSWNKVRVLLTIWPDAPREAIVYAIYHDVGEVGTGDVPFPIKRENPDLKVIMDRLESGVLAGMGIEMPDVDLYWAKRLKVCDLLEMWEFGMEEVLMGNQMAWPIVDRTLAVVEKMLEDMEYATGYAPIKTFIDERKTWFNMAGSRVAWSPVS